MTLEKAMRRIYPSRAMTVEANIHEINARFYSIQHVPARLLAAHAHARGGGKSDIIRLR
jgi:hypothetical protein